MSPVIVLGPGGQLRAALGASGGPRIVSAVLQTLLRVLVLGQDPLAAVAGARLHHQLIPNAVYAEDWATTGAEFRYDARALQVRCLRGAGVREGSALRLGGRADQGSAAAAAA